MIMSTLAKSLALATAMLIGAGAVSNADAGFRRHGFNKHHFGFGIGFVKPSCGFWKFGKFFPCKFHGY
jgi:hypothetical protein